MNTTSQVYTATNYGPYADYHLGSAASGVDWHHRLEAVRRRGRKGKR